MGHWTSGVSLRVHVSHGDCGESYSKQFFPWEPGEDGPGRRKVAVDVVHHDELPDLRDAIAPKGGRKEEKMQRGQAQCPAAVGKTREGKKKMERKEEKKEEGSKGGRVGGHFLLKGQQKLSTVFKETGLQGTLPTLWGEKFQVAFLHSLHFSFTCEVDILNSLHSGFGSHSISASSFMFSNVSAMPLLVSPQGFHCRGRRHGK